MVRYHRDPDRWRILTGGSSLIAAIRRSLVESFGENRLVIDGEFTSIADGVLSSENPEFGRLGRITGRGELDAYAAQRL